MIIITCQNGQPYGFDLAVPANEITITKSGKVKYSPQADVKVTLEFPTPAITVTEEAV